MKILFVGDVVGHPGRRVAESLIPRIRRERDADLVIANAENLAGGFGITVPVANAMFRCGVDVLTSGNHIWDRPEGITLLEEESRLLRPANYPSGNPGRGSCVVTAGEQRVGVVNLQGRVFMTPIDDPFRVGRALVDELRADTNIVVVDFHAEATAEKQAFAHYIDGLVAAVVGTHTHVATADPRILPGGTAYVTDLGMTGSHSGVIGHKPGPAAQRAILGRRIRLELAEGDLKLQGAIVDVDEGSGLARSIERIDVDYVME